MTLSAAGRLGGVGSLLLGLVCLDLLPPLGLAETICAIVVLATRRPGPYLAALVPTVLIAASAVAIMVTVSGPANPVMWPVVVASVVIGASMIPNAVASTAPAGGHRGSGE